MRSVPPLCLLLLAACSGPHGATRGDAGAVPPPTRETATLRELPPGTVLRLRPLQQVGKPVTPGTSASVAAERVELGTAFCEALWREALRQSRRFDVAAGLEDGPSSFEVELVHDAAANTLAATLHAPGAPALTLAAERVQAAGVPRALDLLAERTLVALGERADPDRVPCALAYSADPVCVRTCERALRDANRGETTAALGFLRKARPLDPGCTQVLAALAGIHLERGELAESEKVAREALQLERRLSPATKHRLARVLLRARADDAGLLELGELALRERPHDPQALWTQALALSLLGRSQEATPHLRVLAARWPKNGAVRWHLCLAELACDRAEAALHAIEEARTLLPQGATLRPHALALFHAGKPAEVARLLLEATTTKADDGVHELTRMRAALAILTGDSDSASRLLQEDLAWIAARPSELEARALDFVEAGEVLVRFGKHREVARQITALETLRPMPELVADAMTYLGGLVRASEGADGVDRAEAALRASGRPAWSGMLRAALHRRNGELLDETTALTEVVRATDGALARAALVRVLRLSGQVEEADVLLGDLRGRLLVFAPRELARHPLMSPGRALAFLATLERR